MNRQEQYARHGRIATAIQTGRTVKQVARSFNVTGALVRRICQKAGMKTRKGRYFAPE